MDLNYGNDSFDVESKEIELLILIKMDIIKNRSNFLWYRLRGDHSSEKKKCLRYYLTTQIIQKTEKIMKKKKKKKKI